MPSQREKLPKRRCTFSVTFFFFNGANSIKIRVQPFTNHKGVLPRVAILHWSVHSISSTSATKARYWSLWNACREKNDKNEGLHEYYKEDLRRTKLGEEGGNSNHGHRHWHWEGPETAGNRMFPCINASLCLSSPTETLEGTKEDKYVIFPSQVDKSS